MISLHLPLTEATRHIVDSNAISSMKRNVIIINTARGGVVDTEAIIEAVESKRIAGACLDVYENERDIYFKPPTSVGREDQLLQRLVKHKNVLLTGHQAFLTKEALQNIARTTIENITSFAAGQILKSTLVPDSTS